MIPTSINHWPVLENTSPLLAIGTVPGTTIRLRMHRDVLPLALALAADYGHTVAPLRAGECGAYNHRPANAADAWSDHASGTAWDLNWGHEGAQGPYGGMHTMSAAQIRACAALKTKYGVVIWGGDKARGGDYSLPKNWDPMHYAIRPGVTIEQVKARIRAMGIRPDGTMLLTPPPYQAILKLGSTGPQVKAMQVGLNAYGADLLLDGQYGQKTFDRVKLTQRLHPLWLEWGGNTGPRTYKAVAKPI